MTNTILLFRSCKFSHSNAKMKDDPKNTLTLKQRFSFQSNFDPTYGQFHLLICIQLVQLRMYSLVFLQALFYFLFFILCDQLNKDKRSSRPVHKDVKFVSILKVLFMASHNSYFSMSCYRIFNV